METQHDLKIKALERELAMRKAVYPRRVEAGTMTQQEADREIYIMQVILNDYLSADDPQGLFWDEEEHQMFQLWLEKSDLDAAQKVIILAMIAAYRKEMER